MSRPDLLPHVRDEWVQAQRARYLRHLAAIRRSHRPLFAREVLRGVRMVVRHTLRLTAWAVGLVAVTAGTLAYLFPVPTP